MKVVQLFFFKKSCSSQSIWGTFERFPELQQTCLSQKEQDEKQQLSSSHLQLICIGVYSGFESNLQIRKLTCFLASIIMSLRAGVKSCGRIRIFHLAEFWFCDFCYICKSCYYVLLVWCEMSNLLQN